MDNKRIAGMIRLRDHLKELFELIGIEANKIPVKETPRLLSLLELIVKDAPLYSYLDSLDAQSVRAIKKMKDINIELWNSKENEKYLDELEQYKKTYEAQMQKLKDEIRDLDFKCRALEYEKRSRAEDEEKPCESKQMEHEAKALEAKIEGIKEQIAFRDSMQLRESLIREQSPEEVNALRLLSSLLQESACNMRNAGVEILEGEGEFDCLIHTVTGTVETDDPQKINRVAETVRPGYRYADVLIRYQEIVLYVEKKGDL